MANIKPDPRENRPPVVKGRTDAWLRRNGEGRFVGRLRKANRKEARKKSDRALMPKIIR
jgi:hypothetical protein